MPWRPWCSWPAAGQAGADPLIAAISLCLAATLIPRRKYPVPCFIAAAAIVAAQVVLGLRPQGGYNSGAWQPTVADLALGILLYTLAAHAPRRNSVAGLATCLILSAAAISRWGPAHTAHPGASILAAVTLLGSVSLTAWVLGDSVAYRHRVVYYAALEDRAARLEAERDAQARIAAAAERTAELQERRARAVDDAAARLRRIERDLHDGAQVRLAALALTLGEIKENLDAVGGGGDDQVRARMLIGAAHRNAKETLAELRDLAKGIHPAVLDRGLDAALSALAETSATPVALTVSIAERPSPAIETIVVLLRGRAPGERRQAQPRDQGSHIGHQPGWRASHDRLRRRGGRRPNHRGRRPGRPAASASRPSTGAWPSPVPTAARRPSP